MLSTDETKEFEKYTDSIKCYLLCIFYLLGYVFDQEAPPSNENQTITWNSIFETALFPTPEWIPCRILIIPSKHILSVSFY